MRVISEGPSRITKATIEAAWRRRAPGLRLIVRDAGCRGLALIVNPTGMRWEFGYRPRGTDPLTGRRWPNRTVTLGNPETHSPDDARTLANQLKGQAATGTDPVLQSKARAAAEQRKRSTTLGRLAEEYERALPRRPKMRGSGVPSAAYVAVELAQVRLTLAALQAETLPASELTDVAVRRLLSDGSGERGNRRARFGALSRFLDWAQDAGHITVNPCTLLGRGRRPRAPQARAHYLTPQELARLWRAADELREPVWRDIARFLIAIPCRRGEAARLDWSHLDLVAAEWRQPGKLTKNHQPHRLHLHPLARAILEARYEAAGNPNEGLVFPAPESGKPIDTFSDLKQMLADGAGLSGWTWHDFRRSFATALGEAGVSEVVADAALNHRQSVSRAGVLGIYQLAARWPEQVKAMQLWGRLLEAAIEGRPIGGEVIALPAAVG